MRSSLRLTAALAAILTSASCGSVVRQSRSPVIVTVNSLTAGTGNSGFLLSDVIRMVTSPAPCSAESPCPTVFDDPATALIAVNMKDVTLAPTPNNQVTINRYHVDFARADGRNTPGVDVPYPFDGAATMTIGAGQTGSVAFELVRHTAKAETPLVQLINASSQINTIATVTFYGTDAVGNAIATSGKISVNFANFGDQ
jgi:hypothetical protein